MPKVSVIVPIYNVEQYIERCARSLFEQTLDDIEYIFVDDCTPDDSISILKEVLTEYPERAKSTTIYSMPENIGVAAVRKKGMELTTGDYIIYCDSDDYMDKEMYESMYNMAMNYSLDLVQCDIDVVNDDKTLYSLTCKKEQLNSEELRTLIIDGDISNGLHNKLVKCSVYKNPEFEFPNRNIDEDNVMSVQLAYFSNKLGYINKSYYKAYFNPTSITRKSGTEEHIKRFEDSYMNSQFIISFLQSKRYDNNSKAIIRAKTRPKLFLWPVVSGINGVNKWKRIYPEINWRVIFDKRFPLWGGGDS